MDLTFWRKLVELSIDELFKIHIPSLQLCSGLSSSYTRSQTFPDDSPEWLRSFLPFRTHLSFAPPCRSSPSKMSDSAIHSIAGVAGGILAMTAT